MTNKYSAIAAVISFITQPIPGADELIVVPIHYCFSVSLTRRRGVPLRRAPWLQVSKIIWGGAAVRLFANFTLGLVPVAGLFSNAITAIALTEFLGRYLDATLSSKAPPPEVSMRAIRDAMRNPRRTRRAKRLWSGIRRSIRQSVPAPTPA
ncbi:hypothetical protein [Sorangium sp. So ce1000]|uniref:hypothetical protein n=1 Tax=Sorangium sp. So ce1000 TaxID=3133325 RepID=UPI003F617A26